MKNIRISILFVLLSCLTSMAFIPSKINIRKVDKRVFYASAKNVSDSTDNPYSIIITKNTYELKVYDDQGWYATYPVVFGSKDLGDKMKQGDRRTPDGTFKIILKKINKDWGPELLLNYPNDSSYKKIQ